MFGLSFLAPLFLIGAAAAAVPIILHLIKRQATREVAFSAVQFLKRVPVEEARQKQLRELILLALRVTALILLALAFARPYLLAGGGLASAPVTIVAVDTSFSMSGPGQFEKARALATEAVRSAATGSLVGLVRFDDTADVVVEPTVDHGVVSGSIGRLSTRFGATNYRTALSRAVAEIAGRSGAIVVVTDLQRSGWDLGEGAIPNRIKVVVRDAGTTPANLAVVSVRPEPARTIAVVANSGSAAASTQATLQVDGRQLAQRPVTIGGNASAEVVFEAPLPPTGSARVSIADPTGFAADDVRYVVLDPPRPLRVLVVGPSGRLETDAFYLERALGAEADVSRFVIIGSTLTGLAAQVTPQGQKPDVIVLLATRGLERAAADALTGHVEAGGGILIAAGAEFDGAVLSMLDRGEPTLRVTAASRDALVTFAPADLRHPIFRPLGAAAGGLGRVRFTRAARLEESGGRVLARFSDGTPALLEHRLGRGAVVIFASDLNNRWNDFPLHLTYVPFVHETVRYLAGAREDVQDVVVAEAPDGVARQPGVATVGSEQRKMAVNVDARESNPARVTEAEFLGSIAEASDPTGQEDRPDARRAESQQNFWRYGLMLMLAALAAEGIIGGRMA